MIIWGNMAGGENGERGREGRERERRGNPYTYKTESWKIIRMNCTVIALNCLWTLGGTWRRVAGIVLAPGSFGLKLGNNRYIHHR